MPRNARRWRGVAAATAAVALAVPLAAAQQAGPAPADHRRGQQGALTGATAATVVATPAALTTAQQRIGAKLATRSRSATFGGGLTGRVVDAETGQIVWTRDGTAPRVPASNTKIATALTALQVLGPETRITTRVLVGRRTSLTVYVCLVGGGDPSLTGRALDAMAASTLEAIGPLGGRRIAVSVDDSLFPTPTLATGWTTGYHPLQVAPVRALIVNDHKVMDTAVDAGQVLARELTARGAAVRATVPRRPAADHPVEAATWSSPPVRTLVADMLRVSDNDYAEQLLRLAALETRGSATWADAAAAQRQTLATLGVSVDGVRLHDGSGLSRANRVTPKALLAMLRVAWSPAHPALRWIYGSTALPVAGLTGSLSPERGRFVTAPSSCAKGEVAAKTGTLRDVVALSGVTTGADGRRQIFSFLVNGPESSLTVRRAVDGLAATVHGCW